jgi:hypothetical protein
MTPDLVGLIHVLSAGGVQYIIVGGIAAGVHGALRPTLDLDVVYARDPVNVARLVAPWLPASRTCEALPRGCRSSSTRRPSHGG